MPLKYPPPPPPALLTDVPVIEDETPAPPLPPFEELVAGV